MTTKNDDKVYVNVYFTTREYGGPEEGGWYYDYHTPELCIPTTKEHAHEVRDRLKEQYSNAGKRPLHSVLSDGQWTVCIEEGVPRETEPMRYE